MLLFRGRTILMTRARSRFEKVHRLSLSSCRRRAAAQIAQKRNCRDARMSYATNRQAERSKRVPVVANHVVYFNLIRYDDKSYILRVTGVT